MEFSKNFSWWIVLESITGEDGFDKLDFVLSQSVQDTLSYANYKAGKNFANAKEQEFQWRLQQQKK